MKDNKEIEECVITVKEMSEDEKMQRLAFLRQKAIMDEKAIRRKGYKDGMKAGEKAGVERGIKQGLEQRNRTRTRTTVKNKKK